MRRQFLSLDGGIGNLLFQYAAARTIASDGGTDVVLAQLKPGLAGRLASYVGPIEFPVVDRWTSPLLGAVCPPWTGRIGRFVNLLTRSAVDGLVRDRFAAGHPRPSGRGGRSVFLEGYFQHPSWFDGTIDGVLDRLASRRPSHLPARLDGVVGVHLRRGDYVRLGWDLPLDHYERALTAAGAAGYASVIVLSDDPMVADLLTERLGRQGWTTLSPSALGARSARDDFHLLAGCDAIVLSNSTFAWWAAKLNAATAAGRTVPVFAPPVWPGDADRLLDPAWTRID